MSWNTVGCLFFKWLWRFEVFPVGVCTSLHLIMHLDVLLSFLILAKPTGFWANGVPSCLVFWCGLLLCRKITKYGHFYFLFAYLESKLRSYFVVLDYVVYLVGRKVEKVWKRSWKVASSWSKVTRYNILYKFLNSNIESKLQYLE